MPKSSGQKKRSRQTLVSSKKVSRKGGVAVKKEEVIREIIAEDSVVRSVITVDEYGEPLVKDPRKKPKLKP